MWWFRGKKTAEREVQPESGIGQGPDQPCQTTDATAHPAGGTQRVTVPIFDLACGEGGALTVERALARTPGVLRAYVNPATEMAYIEYDPAVCSVATLVAAVRSRGFRAGEPCLR
jgi:copper chaperone CopZ